MKKILNKHNIILYTITLIINALICFYYFKPHIATDSYDVFLYGYKNYANVIVFPIGRIVTSLFFYTLDLFNIKYLLGIHLSFLISLLFSSLTICLVYLNEKKYFRENKINKVIIYLLSFIFIVNPYTMELYMYFESSTLLFSILMAALSSIIFTSNNKNKYEYSLLLLLICAFTYQCSMPYFIILTLFNLILKENNIKSIITETIKAISLFVLSAIINILYISTSNCLYTYKLTNSYSISHIIKNLLYYANEFFIKNLYFEPKYMFIYIFIALITIYTIINILNKKQNKILLFSLFIIFSIIITLSPMISMGIDLYTGPRMYIGMIAIIPISLIVINNELENKKILNYIFLICTLLIFIINFNYSFKFAKNINEITISEKNDSLFIANKIKEYQQKTNIKVTNIVYYYDNDRTSYGAKEKFGIRYSALGIPYFIPKILRYYGNINLKSYNTIEKDINDEIYIKYFKDKNYNSLTNKNIIFIDNTIYICYY